MSGSVEEVASWKASERVSPFVWLVAALTIFFVAQGLELFPALAGLQIAKLTAVAALAWFLISRRERVAVARLPQFVSLMLILAFAAVTIPISMWPSRSFSFIAEVYAKNVLFAYLLIQAARSDREVRIVTGALIAGCSALVLAMLFGIGHLVIYKQDPTRVSVGNRYDPNDLALLFVMTIPFATFMIKSSRPLIRMSLMAAIALLLIGIIKTGSRGGFLGLLVMGALMLMRGSAQARKLAMLVVLLGGSLFAFAAPAHYWDRVKTIFNYEEDYNLSDKGGRMKVWQTGLKLFAASPIAGVGIACFPIAHAKYSESRLAIAPHNTLLQVATELGSIGLALFLMMVFSTIVWSRRAGRLARDGLAPAELWWLASAIEIGLAGFLVSAFFLSHAYTAMICFLVGMASVLTSRCELAMRRRVEIEEIQYV
jgi:O-antigen ligase